MISTSLYLHTDLYYIYVWSYISLPLIRCCFLSGSQHVNKSQYAIMWSAVTSEENTIMPMKERRVSLTLISLLRKNHKSPPPQGLHGFKDNPWKCYIFKLYYFKWYKLHFTSKGQFLKKVILQKSRHFTISLFIESGTQQLKSNQ